MTKQVINRELKRITKQIAEKYKPEKIILFGSVARGNHNENSDIDLLIVKDTPADRIRRIQHLSSLVDRKVAFQPIVLTPAELKDRVYSGDFFIKEILSEGKVLYG